MSNCHKKLGDLLIHLQTDLDADKTYWIRNTAKLNAATTSKSYEEFRVVLKHFIYFDVGEEIVLESVMSTYNAKKIKKCVGKESFQRINYLYQVSNKLATENEASHKASLQYSKLILNISKKSVQRLDVELKRTICKSCRTLLLPGITCKVRIKKKKVINRCLKCLHTKVFEAKENSYLSWSQKNESLVEILEYTPTDV